jgi:divalent metal cation (Fe/Co/Zn/Cd) transporter
VPIGAVVAVVLAVRSDWRRRISWGWPVAVFILVVLLFIAKESGESAVEADNVFGDVSEHQELGDTTFVLAIVWFVVTLAVTIRDWMSRRDGAARALSADAALTSRDTIAQALAIVAAVAAVITAIWLIRTGHAGAESRWKLS